MKQSLKRLIPIALFPSLCGLLPLRAQPTHAAEASGVPNAAVLVELFTSEGCSSCPSADALLRQINGTKTSTGQLIVGISEHVTYWNGSGWSDPYSSETYTARQNAYANRFRLDSVYTPQMVINGNEQIVGSDRNGLERALQRESGQQREPLHIVSARLDGGTLHLAFTLGGTAAANGADIIAVLADDADRSSVLRGENSGHTLTHVAVARALARVATVHGATEKAVQVALPASFTSRQGGHHLILFVQAAGLGPVLGVDTRPF